MTLFCDTLRVLEGEPPRVLPPFLPVLCRKLLVAVADFLFGDPGPLDFALAFAAFTGAYCHTGSDTVSGRDRVWCINLVSRGKEWRIFRRHTHSER